MQREHRPPSRGQMSCTSVTLRRRQLTAIKCLVCCCFGFGCYQLYSHTAGLITRVDPAAAEPGCFSQILADFGAADLLAASKRLAPVYIRPPRPIPINMEVCKEFFANWTSAPESNISKLDFLEEDKQQRMPSILYHLANNFSQRNLEFFMSDGTLLGSVRHFNIIPWDADLDVMVLANQKPKIRQLLIDLSASDEFYFVDTDKYPHWQMGLFCRANYSRPLKRLYGGEQLYPEKTCRTVVDFFFGQVVGSNYTRPDHPSLNITDIYPLSLRPYGPYLIPAPNRPANLLATGYGTDYEETCMFKYERFLTLDCKSLRPRCPFVAHIHGPQLDGSDPRQPVLDVLVFESNMLALFVPSVVCQPGSIIQPGCYGH